MPYQIRMKGVRNEASAFAVGYGGHPRTGLPIGLAACGSSVTALAPQLDTRDLRAKPCLLVHGRFWAKGGLAVVWRAAVYPCTAKSRKRKLSLVIELDAHLRSVWHSWTQQPALNQLFTT